MGTVYLGEQKEPVRRRVALKVIKLGMDSKAVLARFEAERQALAMMEHDNIARVYECGLTERGQPYFAMEYVKGVPITHYCHDNRLALRDRLDLFQQVCAGIQHAHIKGVIHRDLTPRNILVTVQGTRPVAKIIDFGLARATDHRLVQQTLFTEEHRILGTPPYISPEQAGCDKLDVDIRTDIYSLGILLYELLTGSVPFTRQELMRDGLLEFQRRIREVDPISPSKRVSSMEVTAGEAHAVTCRVERRTLIRNLRRDLDWITMKAVQKDRTRRYQSAEALAKDINRYLRFEPVEAGPPGLSYPIRKFVQRHRLRIAGTLLLASGLGAALWLARQWALASERERLLEPLRVLADFEDLQNAPLPALIGGRQALRALRGDFKEIGADATLVGDLERRFIEYRTQTFSRGRELLAAGTATSPGAESRAQDTRIFEGSVILSRLALLFPEDVEILAAVPAEPFTPRLSASVADETGSPIGGWVSYRRIDPLTGLVDKPVLLGSLPLSFAKIPNGYHRIVFDLDGYGTREATRYLYRGRWNHRIDYSVGSLERDLSPMVHIEGGVLDLRADTPQPPSALYNRPVRIESFLIDQHEVSNAQYRRFVEKTGHSAPPYWDRISPGSPEDQLPVVYVSWDDARAYAEWAGKRLPSFPEWLFAGCGPNGQPFPWGDQGPYRGNTRHPVLPLIGQTRQDEIADYLQKAAPVISHPDAQTPSGLYHMLGNVSEWTESIQLEKSLGRLSPRVERRILCGDYWGAAEVQGSLRTFEHGGVELDYAQHYWGFRCARSISP